MIGNLQKLWFWYLEGIGLFGSAEPSRMVETESEPQISSSDSSVGSRGSVQTEVADSGYILFLYMYIDTRTDKSLYIPGKPVAYNPTLGYSSLLFWSTWRSRYIYI